MEQAERKVLPSTLRPDLVNASVGSMLAEMHSGNCAQAVPRFLLGGSAMVKINGELLDKDGKTVAEMLADMDISGQRVAVEINEEIVPKAQYGETVLRDGDKVEVVRFVGGG